MVIFKTTVSCAHISELQLFNASEKSASLKLICDAFCVARVMVCIKIFLSNVGIMFAV